MIKSIRKMESVIYMISIKDCFWKAIETFADLIESACEEQGIESDYDFMRETARGFNLHEAFDAIETEEEFAKSVGAGDFDSALRKVIVEDFLNNSKLELNEDYISTVLKHFKDKRILTVILNLAKELDENYDAPLMWIADTYYMFDDVSRVIGIPKTVNLSIGEWDEDGNVTEKYKLISGSFESSITVPIANITGCCVGYYNHWVEFHKKMKGE